MNAMTAPGMTPALAAALVKAQAEVDAAVKREINPEKGYNFSNIDEVIRVVKPALAAARLAVLPVGEDIVDTQHGRSDLLRTFWVVHESGAYLVVPTRMPIAWTDEPDKSKAAADSFQLNYALRGFLCLPRLDAPAGVKQVDARPAQPAEPRTQAQVQEEARREKSGAALPEPKPLSKKAQARLEEARDSLSKGGWADTSDTNPYREGAKEPGKEPIREFPEGTPMSEILGGDLPETKTPANDPTPLSPQEQVGSEATRPDGAVSSGAPHNAGAAPQTPAAGDQHELREGDRSAQAGQACATGGLEREGDARLPGGGQGVHDPGRGLQGGDAHLRTGPGDVHGAAGAPAGLAGEPGRHAGRGLDRPGLTTEPSSTPPATEPTSSLASDSSGASGGGPRCAECGKRVTERMEFCGEEPGGDMARGCGARQWCVFCRERDCLEHDPSDDATCSSCGGRAADTCCSGNACSCGDGDGTAHWIEPGSEAPLTAPSQEQVNLVSAVAEKALAKKANENDDPPGLHRIDGAAEVAAMRADVAKKERTATVNVKAAQRRLQRPCFRCGESIQRGQKYEEQPQGACHLTCDGKGAK
jgi:hypothetical protein